ncbi:MAG TPA: hypothetical protein VMW41_06610 [Candidatus Bathyarchaeia archaeon]|nr:hypothetical protein [Candidatus Bathyarchaeia archaeon]
MDEDFRTGDIKEIAKERTINDAVLLRRGASYVLDEQTGKLRLRPTRGQVEDARFEMEDYMEKRARIDEDAKSAAEMFGDKPIDYVFDEKQQVRFQKVLAQHLNLGEVKLEGASRIVMRYEEDEQKNVRELAGIEVKYILPNQGEATVMIEGFTHQELASVLIGKEKPTAEEIVSWKEQSDERSQTECFDLGWDDFPLGPNWREIYHPMLKGMKIGRDHEAAVQLEHHLIRGFGYEAEFEELVGIKLEPIKK